MKPLRGTDPSHSYSDDGRPALDHSSERARCHCGLEAWVYELIASGESVRAEAIAVLGRRFFEGVVPEKLLADVGLQRVVAQGGGSRQLSAYLRLCRTVEASEARGEHDRTVTVFRDQPVRSAAAVKAVLIRSGGRCENPLCSGQPDDLDKHGKPILEVDHVQDRARWGRDHPIQMIALCPNCHAIKTRGRTGERLREILLSEARARHTAWVSQG